MICTALHAFRPGWATEDSFVEDFLCLNLPVVVRWINGSYTTTQTEAFERSIIFTVQGRKKTPGVDGFDANVEFEIYQPEAPQPAIINGVFLAFSFNASALI